MVGRAERNFPIRTGWRGPRRLALAAPLARTIVIKVESSSNLRKKLSSATLGTQDAWFPQQSGARLQAVGACK